MFNFNILFSYSNKHGRGGKEGKMAIANVIYLYFVCILLYMVYVKCSKNECISGWMALNKPLDFRLRLSCSVSIQD